MTAKLESDLSQRLLLERSIDRRDEGVFCIDQSRSLLLKITKLIDI